ncbi:hypothetical protein BDN71DRAFT_987973 [Pleurotus eryngii]|uniref:Uncharacterized protein n=1 Tax=Pleurotus eryngii TaxID=5323 RepID=A0A9P6DFZ4_PLEER|nr:hypothetical protein BDN71DRAFT_987973 [Pleurotus eryngii]
MLPWRLARLPVTAMTSSGIILTPVNYLFSPATPYWDQFLRKWCSPPNTTVVTSFISYRALIYMIALHTLPSKPANLGSLPTPSSPECSKFEIGIRISRNGCVAGGIPFQIQYQPKISKYPPSLRPDSSPLVASTIIAMHIILHAP